MQRCILAILSLAFCAGAQAVSEDVQLNLVTTQGVGQTIGSVKITETDRGLEFAPTLRALPPGKHGFHIHAEGSCQPAMKEGKAVAAGAAGGHYDPQHTGKHEGAVGGRASWRPAPAGGQRCGRSRPADYCSAPENAGGGERESADGPRRRG